MPTSAQYTAPAGARSATPQQRANAESPRIKRWRSPLLWLVLAAFTILTITGFGLFFARPWITQQNLLGNIHTALGLLCLAPYAAYQRAHLRRVPNLRGQLHHTLGILTMLSFLLSGLSGGWIVAPDSSETVRLVHLMSSFAFSVLLTTHLIIVARLALSGAGSK